MSAIDFLQSLLDAGVPMEAAMTAARLHEKAMMEAKPKRSKAAERQARYEARKRQKASESVIPDADDASDAPSPEEKVSPTPPSKTQTLSPPSPPKGGSSPKLDPDFERFWSAYPRKTAKGDARKAYPKALGKVSGPDPPGLLLRALERVKPTWTDPKFIPHAATWLNQERWEDEPEPQIIPLRQAHVRPHHDQRRTAREENHARALAGFEIAARGGGER